MIAVAVIAAVSFGFAVFQAVRVAVDILEHGWRGSR